MEERSTIRIEVVNNSAREARTNGYNVNQLPPIINHALTRPNTLKAAPTIIFISDLMSVSEFEL